MQLPLHVSKCKRKLKKSEGCGSVRILCSVLSNWFFSYLAEGYQFMINYEASSSRKLAANQSSSFT